MQNKLKIKFSLPNVVTIVRTQKNRIKIQKAQEQTAIVLTN
jgi:hypothetical protein